MLYPTSITNSDSMRLAICNPKFKLDFNVRVQKFNQGPIGKVYGYRLPIFLKAKIFIFFQTKIQFKNLSLCSFFCPFLTLRSKQWGSRKWAFGSINLSLKWYGTQFLKHEWTLAHTYLFASISIWWLFPWL